MDDVTAARQMQEVLRALKETQATLEDVRADVAALNRRLDAQDAARRSWWQRVFESTPSDRKPW